MKKYFTFLLSLSLVSVSASAEQLTGYLADERCAVTGSNAAKAYHADPHGFESCSRKCVKNGLPIVFITEDNKVLKLAPGSTPKASAYLGQRVSVTGKVENGSLKIEKIASINTEAQSKPENHQEEKMH